MSRNELSLVCGDMKIIMSPDAKDGKWGYQLFVAGPDDSWRAISTPQNPIVRGNVLNLLPDEVYAGNNGDLLMNGKVADAGGRAAAWSGSIQRDNQNNWFRFDVELESKLPIELCHQGGFEPEITIDLGPLPPYERGDHVWFMTQVANPTKWNDDAYGNDFPATYYFDPYLKVELMLFFDMTRMNWMSGENISRFLNYRCGFRRNYRGKPSGEIGLLATGASGIVFPAGKHHFTYYISARARTDLVDDHDAVQRLVERCLPLLASPNAWPDGATSWADFADHCAVDLMADELCWRRDDQGREYILNYVDCYSPAWKEAIEARGNTFDMNKPCFDAAVWMAHPLAVLTRSAARGPFHRLYDRVCLMMDEQFARGETPLGPVTRDTVSGTWQYLYILEEMFQVARFRDKPRLLEVIAEEVEQFLIPLAKKTAYLLPLSFNKQTIDRAGAGDAHAALGAYANFMIDLHEFFGKKHYLEEAESALRVLHRLPINVIHQEVFLLGMGTQAAYRLATQYNRKESAATYHYLLAQTLRMLYWYDDQTSEQTRKIKTLGMFQACATISYPAIFENIETLARFCGSLKSFPPSVALLRVFDHSRRNNFYFFPRCFDGGGKDLPLQYIPFENLPILEGPIAGTVGQEIYGSGWVFRAFLMWEAFCEAEPRDIMALNLDAFEELGQMDGKDGELTFIIFNGTPQPVQAKLKFKWISVRSSFWAGPRPDELREISHSNGEIVLDMAPDERIFIRHKSSFAR